VAGSFPFASTSSSVATPSGAGFTRFGLFGVLLDAAGAAITVLALRRRGERPPERSGAPEVTPPDEGEDPGETLDGGA
jgi:hypothetical protein